ncbi:MAG: hypothetical protein VX079_07445, partial [Pseudomonadota bacterium]|nr:hypothetical protein [Pseudomonadota bacterium]
MRIARMLAYSEGRASATYLPRLLRLKRIGITWMFSFIAIDARTKSRHVTPSQQSIHHRVRAGRIYCRHLRGP